MAAMNLRPGDAKAGSHKKGGIREMVEIAVPMVVSQACYTIMTFTDRVFLSRLGPEYMNASMVGGLTVFMMMTFFLGLTGYATAIAAQYLGASQKEKCSVTLTQAVIISFLAYPVIFLSKPLARSMFEFMGIDPGQLVHQEVYFNILIAASIVPLLRGAFSAFFSGIGKTRAVMASGLTAMCVNVIMNYILIFGRLGFPAMGIAGAAWGTFIGIGVSAAINMGVFLSGPMNRDFQSRRTLAVSGAKMRGLLTVGLPAGVSLTVNVAVWGMVLFTLVGRFGREALAATS
nr:MATE family efflux transporter [Candidatus Omnitrophota bacterium]